MAFCICCLKETPDITEEHVFPAALGGECCIRENGCPIRIRGVECSKEEWFRSLSPAKRERLLCPQFTPELDLALHTCKRQGEMQSLTWDGVGRKVLTIPR